MNKAKRGDWYKRLAHAQLARDGFELSADSGLRESAAHRYRGWQRALSAFVAATLFIAPITVTVEQSRAAAGVVAAGSHHLGDDAWREIQDLASLRIHFAMQTVEAAAISDPNAPISFQPKITQSTGAGGGVPVVNITAPNAAGISLNQYQSFNVDPVGLILNNSLQGGTTLTGGNVTANPNLNGRTASVIVNQVTSTGSAFASVLNGPLEVFGAPATVIIANPNGIAVRGAGFTNTIGVTLTTGTPTFLTSVGGTQTDFTNAQAVAYDVKGGHIQIEGNAGTNGPGSGIEGTVGTIDLIGETVGINAPLYAGTKINVIAGDQVVSPSVVDTTGTTYATRSNGSSNTAASIGNATQGYAIDATNFGAMTAGQISVIGTAQGMGVRADAALSANAGNLTLSSNGDLTVGSHAAQQNVSVTSAGNTTLSGTGLGIGGYAVSAGGDVTSTGTLQSGADMSIAAGGGVNVASIQANGNASLTAGTTLTLGTAQTGKALTLATQGNNAGNMLLNGAITAGSAFSAVAGSDLTISANVNAGASIALTSGGTTTIGSASQVTGQGLTLTAGLDAQIDGSLASGTTLGVSAQRNLIVSGGIAATGATALAAQQAVNIAGVVLGQANGTISAGTDLSGTGSIAFGTQGTLTAGHNVALTGRLVGGPLQVTGNNDVSLADVESTDGLTVVANGSAGAGDITINGNGSAIGATSFTAARDIAINGAFAGANAVLLNAQRNVVIGGTLQTAGTAQTMTISAGGALSSTGTLNASGALTANTGGALTLGGTASIVGDTTLTAGGNLAVNGTLAAKGNGTLQSSGQIDIAGSGNFLKDASLTSSGDTHVEGSLQGSNVNITAGNTAVLNNVQSNASLSVTAQGTLGGGDVTLNGAVSSFGAATLAAARDITIAGTGTFAGSDRLNAIAQRNVSVNGGLTSVGDMSISAVTGSLSASADISTNGGLTMAAGQSLSLGAQRTSAAGNASLAAGQSLSLGGALVALGGTLSAGSDMTGGGATAFTNAAVLTVNHDINLTGVLEAGQLQIQAGNSASLSNVESGSTLLVNAFGFGGGGDVTLNGTSNTVGATQVNAVRDISVAGALSSGTTVALNAGRNVSVTGDLKSATDLGISASTGNVTTSGTLNAGGNMTASAGTNLTLGGQTTVAGTTGLGAGRDISLGGALNGQGTGLLIAGRDLNGAGSTAFSQTATVLAGRNVQLGGLMQGAGLSITAGNDLTLADVESSSALTLQAKGTAGGGTITLNGTSAAPGAISLTAAQDIDVAGKLGGGSSTVLNASRNINVTGAIESIGDTALTASTGSLSATGGINSGGNLTVTTGQNLALGASTSAIGNVNLNAGSNLTLGGTLVGTNGNLVAGATINDDGSGASKVGFTGAATLNAAGDINLTGKVQADSIQATAAGSAMLGTLQSQTTIALFANGTAPTALGGPGDVTVNGAIASPDAFTVQAARDVALNGTLACGALCSVNAGRNLTVAGPLTASTDVSLSAVSGNLTTSAALTTGGALNASAGGNATLGAAVNATTDIIANAGGALTVSGALTAQGNGTLTAGTDVGGAGAISVGQIAQINAAHDTTLTGSLSAQTVNVTAGNSAGLGAVQASQALTVTANGNAGAGDATFGGNVAALGALNVSAARDIAVTGTTNGGASTTLNAGRNVTLTGALNSVGDISMTAQNGALSANTVSGQGALTASAGQSLVIGGSTTANGDVTLTSAGGMTLGAVTGQASDVYAGVLRAGGDLNATSIAFGNGAAAVQAGGSIGITGALTAATTANAIAGNDASFGSVQAGTALTLQALGHNGAGDLSVAGAAQAGGASTLSAARDLTIAGQATAGGAFNATAGRNLTMGDSLGANGDIVVAATNGTLALNGPVSAVANLTATSGGALAIGSARINGNTSLTSGGAMSIGGVLWGDGTGTFQAGGDITGAGGFAFGNAISATAGGALSLGLGIDGASDVSVKSTNDLTLGALTAVDNATLTSTAGSATIGATQVGGTLNANAAQNLTATSGIAAGGPIALSATNGNLTAAGLQGNGTAMLTAGQGLTLGGTNVLAGNVSLTGGTVTMTGTTTASQGFTAAARGTLDASAAQLYVTRDAALSGATVNSGSMIVGGALTETATSAITTSGRTLVAGAATFNANGGAFTNTANNQVLAGGPLTVTAGTITNGSGASLASTGATTLTAASNMTNAGTINGQSTTIHVGGNLSNGGGTILGSDSVAITTGTLSNANGLIIAGNPFQTGATAGNLSLTVTGGTGGFDNTNGQLSAAYNAAFSLVNMAWDPSAAVGGGIYAGGQLSMTVNALSVGGTWNVNAGGASITALNGASITGAIESTGAFSLASNGVIQNFGQIVGGSTVGLSGVVSNASSALIHANGDLNLSGAVTNQGTLEAQGDINGSGSAFYNAGATTQAQGNITFNFSGEVNNIAGKIAAGNNVSIQAASIVNDQAAPVGTTTTTTVINDPNLLWSSVVGTETWAYDAPGAGDGNDFYGTYQATATLGNLLSPTGLWGTFQNIVDPAGWSVRNCGPACIPTSATPIAGSGAVTFDQILVNLGYPGDGQPEIVPYWIARSGANPGNQQASVTLALPNVYETTTTQQQGIGGVISAGGNLSLSANSLSNRGGQIGAGSNATLNVQSLLNGAVAPTVAQTTTDWVDPTQLSAFINALSGASPAVPGYVTAQMYNAYGLPVFTLGAPVAASTSSSLTWSTATGVIAAGKDMNVYGGNLINEGSLYAQNNVNVYAASLTNQGQLTQQTTTNAGCTGGGSDLTCLLGNGKVRGENPNTSTFSYLQDNASIIAGNDLTIAAGSINNTYGNLIAGHDIVIGGVGTTAGSTTAAQSLTNTSGNILAGNNVTLNVSGSVTNTLPPPVPVHQNYGSKEQYSGCMTADGYKESYCEGYVDQQSGNSSVISAGNTLNIQAGSLTNVGSLITAGVNATINVAGPVINQAQTLNAYWHSHWVQETGDFSADKRHEVWGCGSAAECTALYGSAYTNVGGPIDPPTPVGNIAATIQAPNLSITSSGQIVNVGNVIGQTVSLTGTNLSNGITKSNTYTPVVGNPPQVISLAPASTGLNMSIPATLGGYSASQAKVTGSATTPERTYVLGGTGANQDLVTPQLLLAALPANLQPNTTLFYYDPQSENAALQTQALKETGQATFVNGLSLDSQQQLSVTDQEKIVLYANAMEYAKANDIKLGQALSQQQINELTKPMLWYVEQTVPEPGCTATGTLSCPTVTALVPQVYLPANTSALSADGNIVASDSIELNFGSAATGGSILNTGTISSNGSLTVNTGTLTNQQNQVDVGQIWSKVKGGYEETTGTVVQPGGFMTAAAGQMTLNVSQLNQIGGLLAEVDPDGSTNNAATQQLLGSVLQQLGGNFTQSTVSDNLHTSFVAEGGFGVQQLIAMVAAIAASIVTAGAAAAAMGATLATMTLGESIVVGMASGMAGSLTSQVISGNGIDFGAVLQAGAVGALTAGLTNGITYDSTTGSFGLGNLNQGLNSLPQGTSTLGQLAGISSVGGSLVPQAGQAAASSLPEEIAAMGATATISAGVQTAIEGGSFLNNWEHAAISDAAAVGAFAIGNAQESGFFGSGLSGELGYVAAHGLLGCVAGAAEGTGCAGGAIGGAAGAFLNTTLDANGNIPAPLDVAMTTMVGGLLAGAVGANVQGAATAAENETLNNWLNHVKPSPMQLSEQERSDAALAACNQGNAASCSTYKSLQATSQQRDADLANACAGGFSSPGCRAQVAAALAGGNNVQPVNGTMYAFDPNAPAIKALPDSYQSIYAGSFDGLAAQSLADALPLTPIGIGDIGAGLQALKGLGSTLFGTDVLDAGIQWGKGIMGQGMPWEDFLATQMPSGSRLPPNFKTFDFYDPVSGVATSAKTLDTTTAAKLADPSQVYSSLKGNIDAAANFTEATRGTTTLTADDITARQLQVAVPSGTTAAQWQQINRAIQYGNSVGVKVIVTRVK